MSIKRELADIRSGKEADPLKTRDVQTIPEILEAGSGIRSRWFAVYIFVDIFGCSLTNYYVSYRKIS